MATQVLCMLMSFTFFVCVLMAFLRSMQDPHEVVGCILDVGALSGCPCFKAVSCSSLQGRAGARDVRSSNSGILTIPCSSHCHHILDL